MTLATSNFYLAGPMRGIHLYGLHNFALGSWRLREMGHTVFNPMESDLALLKLDPHVPIEEQNFDLNDAMRRDFAFIIDPSCDGVVLLPGWGESKGAIVEVLVARGCGKPIYVFDDEIAELKILSDEIPAGLLDRLTAV